MAMQITLSDEDYALLAAPAAFRGVPIETLVHEAIAERYAESAPKKLKGVYHYPTGTPLSDAMRAENERIAASLASATPWASDMVIEDRGPR